MFLWALASALYHDEIKNNHERPTVYKSKIDSLIECFKEISLEFPVK